MTRITLADAKALGYCRKGSRGFGDMHGLDWQRFVTEGIPVEEVSHIDDEMMRDVIEQARKREAGHVLGE